jgi:hypothetical protein
MMTGEWSDGDVGGGSDHTKLSKKAVLGKCPRLCFESFVGLSAFSLPPWYVRLCALAGSATG